MRSYNLRCFVADSSSLAVKMGVVLESMHRILRATYFMSLAITIFGAAELTARVDDWWRDEVPLLSSPDSEHSLRLADENGTRGRPLGRYKKWKLNEWGFRGGPVQPERVQGRRRILILGASEAVGLYESAEKEFPSQLANLLRSRGEYDVINAAVTGMSLASMHWHWKFLCAQFRPDDVVIYTSPLFYLGEGTPVVREAPFPVPSGDVTAPKSRFKDRLRDVFDVPQFIKDRRNSRWIAQRESGKPKDWLFRVPPQDRLEAFLKHLRELGRLLQQVGSRVILCTLATRTAAPFSDRDLAEYERGRVTLPRATARAAAEFHLLANDGIREIARDEGWQLVDADEALSGDLALFGDLVHFTDLGAERIAQLLAEAILKAPSDGMNGPGQQRKDAN